MADMHKSPRHLGAVAEKQVKALRLYIDGHTYQQIADQIGYADRSSAHKAVKAALAALTEERTELARHLLDLQVARYTDLYHRTIKALDAVDEGREVGRAQLISAGRGILDSLSRIVGIDHNSAVVTVRTETAMDRELAALTEMMKADSPQLPAGDDDTGD